MSGNFFEQGDFDQCLAVKVEEKFEPQYCMGMVSQPSLPKADQIPKEYLASRALHRSANFLANSPRIGTSKNATIQIGLMTGICVPNTCSPEMIKKIVETLAAKFNIEDFGYNVIENTCQGNDELIFTGGDISMITLLVFFALLAITSTAYDVISTRQGRNKIDVLTAFSVYTNASKLFATKRSRSSEVLDCLNGLRVLSTFWVIYGHSYLMAIPTPMYNMFYLPEWMSNWFSITVTMAPHSVDTFLFLSGFLVTWQLMKHFNKTNGKLNVLLLYLHRYIRLTPLLAVGIFVTMTILTKYSNGPLWHILFDNGVNCNEYWWSTLLYIQNYFNSPAICFIHSWYLSVDFQLFLIAPLLVYLLYRVGHKFIIFLVAVILASAGAIIFVTVKFNLNTKYMDFSNDFFKLADLTYYPTHTRIAPWLIGMIFAYILFNMKDKRVFFTKMHAIFCWTVMLIIFGACTAYTFIIQQLSHNTTPLESGLYLSLTRIAWPIAIALLVLICIRGYGGPVNGFLSSRRWLPMCRLSYAIYIVHMPILLVITASSRRSFFFSNQTMVLNFFGNIVISFAICIIAALLFESPIIKIEKFIFGRSQLQSKRTESPTDTSATSQQDILRRIE